jgi:hypothetical protein
MPTHDGRAVEIETHPLRLTSKTIPPTTTGVRSPLNSKATTLVLLRGKTLNFTSTAPNPEVAQQQPAKTSATNNNQNNVSMTRSAPRL